MAKRNQIALGLLIEMINQQKLENIVDVLDFCDKYRNKFNLPNMKSINNMVGKHVELVQLYFEASQLRNKRCGFRPNMSITSSLKDKFDTRN